jgi:drug/metabolite transporter (DMT)-like permease
VRGGRTAGGALLAGAMTLFNLGDTFVKLLAERLPVAQVICARNLAAGAILLAAWAWRRDLARGRDLLDRHVLARAALDTATTLLYLQGVALLPLAEAATLLFASPLVATALAGPLLGERVDGARWLAVGAGFAGVLLVVQPGAVDWRPATLLPLAAAFVMAASDLVTRRIRPEVAAAAATWAALAGPRPLGAADAAPLAAAAALLLAGYLCYVAAFRLAEVSFVAPFKYGGLPAAALLGWLVWGHVPNATSVLGGAVIVACGLFLLAREGRAEPRAA